MSGRLIMDSKAIVNRMSSRQFGRVILGADLSRRLQPGTGSLLVRIKTVLPRVLMCV